MSAITVTDLNNAKLDVDHIADVATSLGLTSTDRLGNIKMTVKAAIDTLLAFNSRGAWVTATAYAVRDLVLSDGTWYACVVAHTSSAAFATDSAAKWRVHQGVSTVDLSAAGGAGIVGYDGERTTVQDQLDILYYGITNVTDDRFAGGCVLDGDASTYAGTDNSEALQAVFDSVLLPGVIGQGGGAIYAGVGVCCFNNTIDINITGVAFLKLMGNGYSTRFIYRGTGKAFNFIGGGYDGTYPTMCSRITLDSFLVGGLADEVATGITQLLSFTNCAEVKLSKVYCHYGNEGVYIKDSPIVLLNNCETINCGTGVSIKKSRSHPDADVAGIEINGHLGSGSLLDIFVDGGRDIKINGGLLVSTQAVFIRASGSTIASDQVEFFQMNGTFVDYQDYSTPAIQIGHPDDTTFQIKKVELNGIKYATSPLFTKDIVRIDSPLAINVSVDGGECSEVVGKFLTIGSSCLSTLQVNVDGIGANNCFKFRIRDERSTTKRSELFQHQPSLQHNPEFFYFATGYYPLGFDIVEIGHVQRSTTAGGFVTGDCALRLLGTAPTPAAPVWKPQHGDVTVDPGTDLEIEWIVLPETTTPKGTLWITTTNLDGSDSAETVADPLLTSIVQEFANGFTRLIHAYKVPNNKVCTDIRVRGVLAEEVRVDTFAVYGPSKYGSDEALYVGPAAHLSDAAMKIAKFRGRKLQKRAAGEADEIYTCRKDAGGTYSWQLIA